MTMVMIMRYEIMIMKRYEMMITRCEIMMIKRHGNDDDNEV